MAIIKAVLPANKPESMTESPYEGKKKGKNIITKIPNPNPLTRWMKLAMFVNRKMKVQVSMNVLIFTNHVILNIKKDLIAYTIIFPDSSLRSE